MSEEIRFREGDHIPSAPSATDRSWLYHHELRRCWMCGYIKRRSAFNPKNFRTCIPCSAASKERRRMFFVGEPYLWIRRSWHKRLRAEVLNAYGNRCSCCGINTSEFLAVDHVNGGGKRHRKELGSSGTSFYLWLRRNGFPNICRLLCHNCNHARGIYGYCPHERTYEHL